LSNGAKIGETPHRRTMMLVVARRDAFSIIICLLYTVQWHSVVTQGCWQTVPYRGSTKRSRPTPLSDWLLLLLSNTFLTTSTK